MDTVLGPEMKSTGEVMGLDAEFGTAFAKSQAAAYGSLPTTSGTVFVSVANRDKRSAIFPVKRLADLGCKDYHHLWAPRRCCAPQRRRLRGHRRVQRGPRQRGWREILAGEVDIVVDAPFGSPGNSGQRLDGYEIRTAAVARGTVPYITTVQGMAAAVQGVEALRRGDIGVAQPARGARRARWTSGKRPMAISQSPRRAGRRTRRCSGCRRGGRPTPSGASSSCGWPHRRSPSAPNRGSSSAFAIGGATSELLLRRSIAIAGAADGVVSVVVAAHGPGSTWLAGLQTGDERRRRGAARPAIPAAEPGTPALLVGGGYGAAALVGLAARLRAAGAAVDRGAGAAPPTGSARSRSSARVADAVDVDHRRRSAGRRAGHRSAARDDPRRGRGLRVRADGDAAAVADAGRGAGHPGQSPSRSRWPAASASA